MLDVNDLDLYFHKVENRTQRFTSDTFPGNIIGLVPIKRDIKNNYITELSKNIDELEIGEVFSFIISYERDKLYNTARIVAEKSGRDYITIISEDKID